MRVDLASGRIDGTLVENRRASKAPIRRPEPTIGGIRI